MKKTVAAFVFAVVLGAGCGDDTTPRPDVDAPPSDLCEVIPGAWSAPNFATNATDALALRAQLQMLTGDATMQGVEKGTGTNGDTLPELEAVYNGGTPVLSAQVHAGAAAVIDDAFADFVAAVGAGQVDLFDEDAIPTPAWSPGNSGGLFDPMRLAAFNTGGIELRQIVDKALFGGGALYPYALGLTEGTITEATIDSLAAAWGTNSTLDPTLPSTDPNRLVHSANYTYQMGFHGQAAQALTDAKAYAADANCTTERDAAIVMFFRTWEQSLLARTVFYANAGETALATAPASTDATDTGDQARANAIHEHAEGLGLAIGFHGLPHPTSGPLAGAGRTATDADLVAMLAAIGLDHIDLGASTVGDFVTEALSAGTTFRTGVTTLESRVKTVYGLSDADIVAFRAPTAN